ncbi:MAG: hypothetical protein JXB62_22775 [Pirellulales bacterium]|nr:hypothetical protein [Pirellulales bacterium]
MRISNRVTTTSLVIPFAFFVGVALSAEPEIGVLTLHGVGSQRRGSDFDAELREILQDKAGEKTRIVVKTVYFHGESRNRQSELWKEFDRLEDRFPDSLDHKIIRRLMLVTVGDALAYANNPTDENSFYRCAHNEVRSALDSLEAELGEGSPVAVVAHSLGCKVVFDYLCDVQTGQGIWAGNKRPSEFQKLANLRLLITTGCNLPFFDSAVPATEQRFFRPNKEFQWVNFYDRDDLLGWPLRPLGGRFGEIVQDEERNRIGSLLTSHFKYWQDDQLNEEIAERILRLTRTNTVASE